MRKYSRVLLLGGILALVALFFAAGLHRELSLESIKAHQSRLQELYNQKPAAVIAAFAAVYIPVVALNLPGAVVLGLAAGALFGALAGTILISFASSIGATLACALSRYLLRDWVQRKFADKLKRVNAGSQLGRIESVEGILSPALILSFALIGALPLVVRRLLRFYKDRFRKASAAIKPTAATALTAPTTLEPLLKDIRERCTECGACTKACAFLAHYGTPKAIATGMDFSSPRHLAIAYECSLCRLCNAVCPEKLDPFRLFLEIRYLYVDQGHFDKSAYGAILGYEKRGTSPLFSWYGLPDGCDTVFFPGCTLPGTRPEVTRRMFRDLQKVLPALGIVLDCCTKPSHDLGRKAHFNSVFGEMTGYLSRQGVKQVLVACPNCFKIFQHHGNGISVRTVYEFIHANGFQAGSQNGGREVSVHDPCALRYEVPVHKAVRGLLSGKGLKITEMKHRGRRTVCCGEGGMVGFVKPEFAKGWAAIREHETADRPMVAYCAGCTGFLNRVAPTVHIADLLYRPEASLSGNLKVARAPFTYLNRILLKRRLKKELNPKTSRVRRLDLAESQSTT